MKETECVPNIWDPANILCKIYFAFASSYVLIVFKDRPLSSPGSQLTVSRDSVADVANKRLDHNVILTVAQCYNVYNVLSSKANCTNLMDAFKQQYVEFMLSA